MKALLFISALFSISYSVKIQTDVSEFPESPILAQIKETIETSQTADVRDRVKELFGKWEGYAWFFRKNEDFANDEDYTPYPITDFDFSEFDSPIVSGDGRRFLHEILEVWPEGGKNLRSNNDFSGIGYIRRLRYIKLDSNNNLIKDENGEVVVEPRLQNE